MRCYVQISDANAHSEITTTTPWMEEQNLTKDVTLLIHGARLCEKR